jgi:hypothetical protein
MSFSQVLKSVGKDLSHVEQWIGDGIEIATPIVGAVDPELAPIFTLLDKLFVHTSTSTSSFGASELQKLITSISANHAATTSISTSTTSEVGLITLAEKLNSLFTTNTTPK